MERFKAGLVLEAEVSRALADMGIAHRRTHHLGKEDTRDRVDLVVPVVGGRRTLEFQLTLRAKQRGKMYAFALRALTTRLRGVRIYMEVVGARRKDNIARVAKNVARAIHMIVRRFRDFGVHKLLGVRVDARNAAIEKFDLVRMCGSRLIEAAQRILSRIQEADRLSRARKQRGLDVLTHLTSRFLNWKQSRDTRQRACAPHVDTRALYVPRRFC